DVMPPDQPFNPNPEWQHRRAWAIAIYNGRLLI
ncbi:unnamed protein product, partial [marine sediment metagenome]